VGRQSRAPRAPGARPDHSENTRNNQRRRVGPTPSFTPSSYLSDERTGAFNPTAGIIERRNAHIHIAGALLPAHATVDHRSRPVPLHCLPSDRPVTVVAGLVGDVAAVGPDHVHAAAECVGACLLGRSAGAGAPRRPHAPRRPRAQLQAAPGSVPHRCPELDGGARHESAGGQILPGVRARWPGRRPLCSSRSYRKVSGPSIVRPRRELLEGPCRAGVHQSRAAARGRIFAGRPLSGGNPGQLFGPYLGHRVGPRGVLPRTHRTCPRRGLCPERPLPGDVGRGRAALLGACDRAVPAEAEGLPARCLRAGLPSFGPLLPRRRCRRRGATVERP
jgi:hypothetical protein